MTNRRFTSALLTAAFLAGCGSDVPSPQERLEAEQQADPAKQEVARLVLQASGLVIAGQDVRFSADRAAFADRVADVLGEGRSRGVNGECGGGPMESVDYGEGLVLNFQDDRFVGWFARGDASDSISIDGEIGLGVPREAVEDSPAFRAYPESTLGEEFSWGEGIGGFIEDGKVSILYAGLQCFFR